MKDEQRPPRRPEVRQSGAMLAGTRPGDQRLRVARRQESEPIPVPELAPRRRHMHPALVFVYGFAAFILLGALVLTLPVASADGRWTPFLTALFTATSAVCVTGLVVVDTGTYWSGFGQAAILTMIQLGGFGFMTSSTLLLLLIGRRATLRERILLQESLGGGALGSALRLTRRIVVFTLVAEVVGAAVLTARFLGEVEAPQALWWGVFHAVSAFNNAGFDLFGGYRSLTPFAADALVLVPIALLLMLGAASYTVVEDVVRRRSWTRLMLDSKLVLATGGVLVLAGMVGLLFTERGNPATLGGMEMGPRLLNAFFHSVTPRTAGFNSLDLSQMTEAGLLITIALMFIGGASGSTAGGIKLQTFSLLFFAIVAAVRGHEEVGAFRREVPIGMVLRALAVALLAVAVVFGVALLLNVVEPFVFLRVFFEAVSAFATVGLTTGITPETTAAGRIVLIATMFVGRLGPLTLVLALAAREHRPLYRWPEEGVKIG